MKVNEIVIVEGLWDDLKKQGQQNQAELWKGIKTAVGDLNPLGPVMKNLQQKVAAKVQAADTDKLVDAWVKEWQKEWEKVKKSLPAPPAGPQTDLFPDDVTKAKTAQYQVLFRSWLEKITKVNVDLKKIQEFIRVMDVDTNFESVRNYLKTHFIPGYIKAQSDPVQTIPNKEKVWIQTTIGGKKKPKTWYEWEEAQGRFIEVGTNKEVPTYTELHKDLLQLAMQQVNNRKSPTLAGGASATTI